MTRGRLAGLAVVLVLLAGGLAYGARDPQPRTAAVDLAPLRAAAALAACPPGLGPDLPRADLPCLGGGPAVPADRPLGRPAVVNAWAWWCQPCQAEIPLFVALAARAGDRLAVVGVASDPDERLALEFARDMKMHYPNVLDAQGAVFRRYGQGLPQTLFLDAQGKVVHVASGQIHSAAELDALVSKHLGVRL